MNLILNNINWIICSFTLVSCFLLQSSYYYTICYIIVDAALMFNIINFIRISATKEREVIMEDKKDNSFNNYKVDIDILELLLNRMDKVKEKVNSVEQGKYLYAKKYDGTCYRIICIAELLDSENDMIIVKQLKQDNQRTICMHLFDFCRCYRKDKDSEIEYAFKLYDELNEQELQQFIKDAF